MTFQPSPQQLAIFDFVANDTRSLIVEAKAGTGKTTTLVELSKLVPQHKLSLLLAFNKNIATELQSQIPLHIQAKTFHSHCLSALQRNLPKRPKIDGNKVFNILSDNLSWRDQKIYAKFVNRLVGYAKNAGIGTSLVPDEPAEWFNLIDHFNMVGDTEDFDDQQAVQIASQTLGVNNDDVDTIDFDDMLYLALLRNVTFDKNNYVMLDEAQDTNGVQRALLKRMLAVGEQPVPNLWECERCGKKQDGKLDHCVGCGVTWSDNCQMRQVWGQLGRLIAVGDSAQSIYGFRGADSDAMETLQREFNCEVLPLSVSYRCAQSIVREAQKTVPEIEHYELAPLGSVEHQSSYDIIHFDHTSAILCRVTAPLVSLAFGFIRRNVGVRILGREIGVGLTALVKKMATQDVEQLQVKLRAWRERERAKALTRGHESAAAAIDDKYDCLMVFIDQLDEANRTVSSLNQKIESLFSDNNKGLLTLCSVHKAKGLEWPTVFILDRDKYMPSKYATQPWQRKQEQNLIYVAVTRAKLDLRFINSGQWKQVLTPTGELAEEKKRSDFLATL